MSTLFQIRGRKTGERSPKCFTTRNTIDGVFFGKYAIILECTQEAGKSDWVQNQLQAFASQIGFTMQQTVLMLHETWPARRTRWWAILAHAALCIRPIPRMPVLRFEPTIIHVLKALLSFPESQLQQLALSKYELRQFYSAKGGFKILDMYKAMPTATHSWGSQVVACLCGCRSQGFSQERLDTRGLYAVLIPLDYVEKWGTQELQAMRHPHPQEVAFLNGLDPAHVEPSAQVPVRLELAGVGQLASPLQGAWVLANVIAQVGQNSLHPTDLCPRHVLAQMCRKLLVARDQRWNVNAYTKPMKLFHQEIESLDRPWIFQLPDDIQADPAEPPSVDSHGDAQNSTGDASEPDSVQPSVAKGDFQHPTNNAQPSDAPVTPVAKPLPRPGCGGLDAGAVQENQTDQSKIGPRVSQSCMDTTREGHSDGLPQHATVSCFEITEVSDGMMNPPTRAKSLPRLGCGDPSQKCQDGTKCSDDHNGDHGSVLEEAVCEQDPYPDPAALADQQDSPSSGHAEAAVVHALFLPSRRTTQMQDLRKTTHDHSRSPPLKIFMMIRNSIPKSFKHWKQQPCPPQGNSSKQGQCQVLQSKDHLTPTTQ